MLTYFSWDVTSAGVYFFNFSYGGDSDYMLSRTCFAAVAQVSPVCLSFTVTPSEFVAGSTVALRAEAVNPLDDTSLQDVSLMFLQDGSSTISNKSTGSDGVATEDWTYQPDSGSIWTVTANANPGNTVGNCTLAVEPVTLTVGNETSLMLSAWRDPGDTGHTVYAQLVNGSGCGLGLGYTVTLTVNGTAYVQQTNQSGYVSLHLTLQPGDTSANMYQVLAMFNGTNSRSASLNCSDPYGDQYAVCTTSQYDLRPSTNSSRLFVLLQNNDPLTRGEGF